MVCEQVSNIRKYILQGYSDARLRAYARLAGAHGEDGSFKQRVQFPASISAPWAIVSREQPAAKPLSLNFFCRLFSFHVLYAFGRAHQRRRADQAGQLVGGEQHLFHQCVRAGYRSRCRIRGSRRSGSCPRPRRRSRSSSGAFWQCSLGIKLKIDIVQKPDRRPVVRVAAEAQARLRTTASRLPR